MLLKDPDFVPPELERVPVFVKPDLHTIPACPALPPWLALMDSVLGPAPVFVMDVSGSMCAVGSGGLRACEHHPVS